MTTHRHSLSGKYTSSTDVPIPSVTGLAKQTDLDALAARVLKLEQGTSPITPPVVIPSSQTLQEIIDGTQAGGSVDLTGWSGTGGATISKPISIKGGEATLTTDRINVTAKGVTLDGFGLNGSKTAYAGIWATHADGLQVINCPIHDFVYAGIMVLETAGGQVSRNVVQRIGMGQPNGTNAYGIAFSDLGGSATSDFLCDANLIEDVPTWEGIDTHNGLRLVWSNNLTRRVRRPYWINASGGKRPGLCLVKGNRAEQVPQPVFDPLAYLAQNSDSCSFLNNSQSLDYPVGTDAEWHNLVRDYLNGSTNLISSGNVRT